MSLGDVIMEKGEHELYNGDGVDISGRSLFTCHPRLREGLEVTCQKGN